MKSQIPLKISKKSKKAFLKGFKQYQQLIIGLFVISIMFGTLSNTNIITVNATPKQPWNVVDAYWGTQLAPMDVNPGDQNVPLSIIIQYIPEEQIPSTGISIELLLDGPFSVQAGKSLISYPTVIGGITGIQTEFNPGNTGIIEFIINIQSNAQLGSLYSFNLNIMYFEKVVGQDLNYETSQVPFTVQLFGNPHLEVGFLDPNIIAEKETEIVLLIENTGSAGANDVQVTLTVPPPLIMIKGSTMWNIGQLAKDNSQELKYTLYAPLLSVSSTFQIGILLTYRDQNGLIRSETHSGGVKVLGNTETSTSNLHVELSDGAITAGKINPLSVQVTNLGSNDVYDLSVSVELITPLIITGSDNQWYFEQLSTKDSQELLMDIYAPESASDRTFPIIVTLTFKDHTGIGKLASRTLGLLVVGNIDLVVYDIITTPSLVPIGGTFTVSGSILNQGNIEALYANVTILGDMNFQTDSDSVYYVGQIDPNAPIPFAVTGYVNPELTEGEYSLLIELRYRDTFGVQYTITTTTSLQISQDLPITTTGTSTGGSGISNLIRNPFVLLGLIVIVVYVILRIFRKSDDDD